MISNPQVGQRAPAHRLTALAPWFGAKRNLASQIIAELDRHTAYWEPFCGSMAVLLAKPPCAMETVNDLHGDLINLARVIQAPQDGPTLYRRLRRTLMVEQIHRQARQRMSAPFSEGWERAYWYFIDSWLGRNGVSGTSSYNNGFCVRFTRGGGHAARRFASAIDSIPAWRRRLRQVTILQLDAFDLLRRIADEAGTAIYVDPPYLVKGARYVHDFEPDDHRRLAEALARFRNTRVVVSYYDHAALAELYPGWSRRTIEVSKALAHAGRRGTNDTRATEVLLSNGPILTSPASSSPGLFDAKALQEVTP